MFITNSSCSKSDDVNDIESGTTPTPTPIEQPIDYSPFQKFISDKVTSADYCKSFSATTSDITLTTVSGAKITTKRGDVPYISVTANGSYTVNGKSASGLIKEATSKVSTSVSATGDLIINGTNTAVKSGTGLHCIINARKTLSLCFPEKTLTLPSEIYNPYNPPLPENPKELSILFIGNSFTVDATEHLPAMINASGINNVTMTRLYHGGYTLPEYFANFNTANVCARYDFTPGNKTWQGNATLDDKPADALKAHDWDIIVIQEHTGRAEAWSWPGQLAPAVEGLRDMFFSQKSKRPTVIYLLAQTYSNNSAVLVSSFGNSREQMFATTTSVAKELMADTGIDIVISSAATIENLRTSRLNVNNGLQLTRDGYHLDLGISRYAAACAVFETIITPVLGYKITECPFRYSTASTTPDNYSTPVTDD
ncbi:MAG: DUF4886 domain-containing protein, partial [Muribaculaceae bacterium]|nr:DUF4886 domain-containing protein [Muribaculaceae bacterium]